MPKKRAAARSIRHSGVAPKCDGDRVALVAPGAKTTFGGEGFDDAIERGGSRCGACRASARNAIPDRAAYEHVVKSREHLGARLVEPADDIAPDRERQVIRARRREQRGEPRPDRGSMYNCAGLHARIVSLRSRPLTSDVLALFDLDQTLLDGDCDEAWVEFLIEREGTDRAAFERGQPRGRRSAIGAAKWAYSNSPSSTCRRWRGGPWPRSRPGAATICGRRSCR